METFKLQDTEWRLSSAQELDSRKAKENRKGNFFLLADFSTELTSFTEHKERLPAKPTNGFPNGLKV